MNTAYPHLALDLRASAARHRRAGDHQIADALETIANRLAHTKEQ
ncbi:hypothetical protein PP993_gp34 [Gordonia phage Mayweather]|uniref:Uncharacterized protein n=1 Tax=Gordonia phage Mayweather TaxID=2590931 RepID=A0A516KU48_9CAUD|nr:hypothetical protein PP993_gp34 [Gordonia phage Mayweather]QDP45196.1 hypothetical protein SEA_MAYWEATHER_34 [Gordonia phage Mayweather]